LRKEESVTFNELGLQEVRGLPFHGKEQQMAFRKLNKSSRPDLNSSQLSADG